MALSQTEVIRAGAFLARSIYGGDYIDADFRGALKREDDPQNYDDDYSGYIATQTTGWTILTDAELGADFFSGPDGGTFTDGGLYVSPSEDGNGGEVLVIEAMIDGEKTLIIVFRGSDGEDAALEAQTFTKEGVAYYYLLVRPAILAAAQYAEDHGIENIIVAGHSLGATMVDVFALADADLFAGKTLYLVSMGSAGVVPDLPDMDASLGLDLSNSVLGDDGEIVMLGLPDGVTAYYAINHTEDRVYHSIPADGPGLTANFVLYRNKHFDGATEIALPNIDNADVDYTGDPLYALFNRGFGAEHNSALYWSNIDALTRDPHYPDYSAQSIIMGVNDYAATQDYGGGPFPTFVAYTGGPGAQHDRYGNALTGTGGMDYILGLAGHDDLSGLGGHDLLSGGDGRDTLKGGNGNDKLDGGDGHDKLVGGYGKDTALGGTGADTLIGNAGDDSLIGQSGDDLLKGGDDDDLLRGGDDDDRLEGNRDSDTLIGNDGDDLLKGGGQADLLAGGRGSDTLRGGAGADTLRGGGQADRLEGGSGHDTLTGGGGADVFVFDGDANTGQDEITDFHNGTDMIEISGAVEFGDLTITQAGGNTVVIWSGGSVTLLGETGTIDEDDFLFT